MPGISVEPILRDYLVQRHRKGADAVGRPGIGLGPVRIAAAQGRASGEFPEKLGDSRGVESSHTPNNAQRRDFAPAGGVHPPHRGSNLKPAPHRLERAPLHQRTAGAAGFFILSQSATNA